MYLSETFGWTLVLKKSIFSRGLLNTLNAELKLTVFLGSRGRHMLSATQLGPAGRVGQHMSATVTCVQTSTVDQQLRIESKIVLNMTRAALLNTAYSLAQRNIYQVKSYDDLSDPTLYFYVQVL